MSHQYEVGDVLEGLAKHHPKGYQITITALHPNMYLVQSNKRTMTQLKGVSTVEDRGLYRLVSSRSPIPSSPAPTSWTPSNTPQAPVGQHKYAVGDKFTCPGKQSIITIVGLNPTGYDVISTMRSGQYFKPMAMMENTNDYQLIVNKAASTGGYVTTVFPIGAKLRLKISSSIRLTVISQGNTDPITNTPDSYVIEYTTGANAGHRAQRSFAHAHLRYEIVPGSIMTGPPAFNGAAMQDAYEFKVTTVKAEKNSDCDCGGHKCGYRDDELHGHATWCKLNDKVTISITHEERK
jgi:hypothetical protein